MQLLGIPQGHVLHGGHGNRQGIQRRIGRNRPHLADDQWETGAHIYEVTAPSSEQLEPKHLCGPVRTIDGDTDNTVFGCALTSTGVLYLCIWNKNCIIRLDLNNDSNEVATATMEIPIPAPNDVCVDPSNEDILYTAGGNVSKIGMMSQSSFGVVTKVVIDSSNKTFEKSVVKKGLTTLAGIEAINDTIVVAALTDMYFIDKHSPYNMTKIWEGHDGKGACWLSDNVCVFHGFPRKNQQDGADSTFWLCPAYNSVSSWMATPIKMRTFLALILAFVQLYTAIKHEGARHFREIWKSMRDPEVDLSLSWTYVDEKKDPKPLRFIIGDLDSTSTSACSGKHFEVDLEETRKTNPNWKFNDPRTGDFKGERYYFCEQVTHMSHLKNKEGDGFITCINFQQPRIMFMNDSIFEKKMSE